MWNVVRGFLPCTDPVQTLSVKEPVYLPLVQTVERVATSLVPAIKDSTVREEIVYNLRKVVPLFDHGLFDAFGSPAMDERAFFVYSYFACSFVNLDKPLNRLAKEITIPIVRLAERVQRKPVLDYCSYVLYNWRRKDPNGPIQVDNLEPLLTFSDTAEEKRFIVARVAVEACAEPLFKAKTADKVSECLCNMEKILRESPPLPQAVQGYFKQFSSVRYEGWGWPDPQTFVGDISCQSSIIPLVARLLGVAYNGSELMDYKPLAHRQAVSQTPPLPKLTVDNDCIAKFYEVAALLSQPNEEVTRKRLGVNQ